MAIKTTLEQLEEIQTAISAVCAGQSVTFEGHNVTLANLADLERREEKLLTRYKAETGTGGTPAFNQGIKSRY